MIIAPQRFVSLSRIRLDGYKPFEIWQVANEGQQPFIRDIKGGGGGGGGAGGLIEGALSFYETGLGAAFSLHSVLPWTRTTSFTPSHLSQSAGL